MANVTIQTKKPQHTPDPVTVRLKLSRREYKDVRRLSVELDRPVGELLHEGVEMLFRTYQAMGAMTVQSNREDACDG